MRFFIVLSVDIPASESVGDHVPSKRIRRKLELTERDSDYRCEYIWSKGKHRKYVGILSKDEFEDLLFELDMTADSRDAGSFKFRGMLFPLILFSSDVEDSIVEMIVQPLPRPGRKRKNCDEMATWKRVRCAVIKQYENGVEKST